MGGSFGEVEQLFQAASKRGYRRTRKDMEAWLGEQDMYTLHKQARRQFKRNMVTVDLVEQWQADLVDMKEYSKYNAGYGLFSSL